MTLLDWPSSWGAPPAFATRPNPRRATHGPAIAEISALLGKPVMPMQRFVLDVATEVDPGTGGPWYETIVVFVQRRAGKTVLVPPLAAKTCGGDRTASVWLTAQKRDNAVKRWRDATDPLVRLIPDATARRKVGQGFEEMRWRETGSLFAPFAPNEEGMHGEDPDVVVVDEFWTLGLLDYRVLREGYSAAWSVKPGQEWLLSAAGTHSSTAMKHVRKLGREATQDPGSRVAYFEWAIPETVGGTPVEKLDDQELLRLIMAHHPRAGFGLKPDFVAGQLRADRTAALRAYGGLDSDTSEGPMVIDGSVVRRSLDRTRRIPDHARVAFGLSSDPDLRDAAISVAWHDPATSTTLTEVIDAREQVRWSTTAAVELLLRWPGSILAVRTSAEGRDLADEVAVAMAREGVELSRLVRVPASDYAAACHRLRSGMESTPPTVLHLGERALRVALQHAEVKGRVWAPGTGPISVLEAHTLATWAATRVPAEPAPTPRFAIY